MYLSMDRRMNVDTVLVWLWLLDLDFSLFFSKPEMFTFTSTSLQRRATFTVERAAYFVTLKTNPDVKLWFCLPLVFHHHCRQTKNCDVPTNSRRL